MGQGSRGSWGQGLGEESVEPALEHERMLRKGRRTVLQAEEPWDDRDKNELGGSGKGVPVGVRLGEK